jgi:putative endonuclease
MGSPGVYSKAQRRTVQRRTVLRRSMALQGAWAEQRALGLLQQQGWQLVVRNWRCRWGEIDVLVEKPGRLLLVEVKGRRRCGPDGWGVGAVHRRKRNRLEQAWRCWLADHPQWQGCSLQVVVALVPLAPALQPVRWISLTAGFG